jgi:hypothetical protein
MNSISVLFWIILLVIIFLALFSLWLYLEYNKKLDIENGKSALASSLATVYVEPGRTPHDEGIARVTVYEDMIVVMRPHQWRRFRSEVRDYETGIYRWSSSITQGNAEKYRFAHVINRRKNLKSLRLDTQNKIEIEYVDLDRVNYKLVISDPIIFHKSYLKLLATINEGTGDQSHK